MNKILGVCGAVLAALFLCRSAQAVAGGEIAVDTTLSVSGAVSSTYSMRADGMNWASAEVVITSVTSSSTTDTFTGGAAATATLTVASYTGLNTAAATGQFTMVSPSVAAGVAGSAGVVISSNVSGTQIAITGPPGALNYMVGGNVAQGYSSTNTAVNFATQVNLSSVTSNVIATVNASLTVVTVSCVSSGTFCNSYAVTSTSSTAISTAAFSGGTAPVVVTVGFAQFMAGRDFAVGATTATMAQNLSAAIVASSNTIMITSTATYPCTFGNCGVVYATATITGTVGNLPMASSNQLAVSTSGVFMTGGQNNASVCINSYCWTANASSSSFSPTAWYPATSNNATATSLAATINASSTTTGVVASALSSVVYATATVIGASPNSYVITVTTNAVTPSVLVSSVAATGTQVGIFSGGTNAGYTFNGTMISLPGNNLQTGEAVWFSSTTTSPVLYYSTGTAGAVQTALAVNTTYYVIDQPPYSTNPNIQLALTSTGAVAGLAMVFTSSSAINPAPTYTLNVAAIAGAPSAKWMVSNDNTNWVSYPPTPFNITISTIGFGGYFSTGAVTTTDFGHMDWGWLGFSLNAPTQGAVNASVKIIGKQN